MLHLLSSLKQKAANFNKCNLISSLSILITIHFSDLCKKEIAVWLLGTCFEAFSASKYWLTVTNKNSVLQLTYIFQAC